MKHFVRMFYLCFILTNKVINNVKVYFSHNKKNTTIDTLSVCGLFFFTAILFCSVLVKFQFVYTVTNMKEL